MRSLPSLSRPGLCFLAGTLLASLAAVGCSSGEVETAAEPEASDPIVAALADALSFHASFDNGADADFASGDSRIYSAPSYNEADQAAPGVNVPGVEIASGAGRFGDALRFGRKNTQALFYRAKDNVSYSSVNMSGAVSFWLSLDPAVDLEPGFCDPIQVTDKAYNDSAVWVDFTDKNPRKFRLGVFGDLEAWNPENKSPAENPDFENRLVVVDELLFRAGQWTHVTITYSGLNAPGGGTAKLYLDGELQGAAEGIGEPFTWDADKASIRLGVNYVGLYDELTVFSRALSDEEVAVLHGLERGAAQLHP